MWKSYQSLWYYYCAQAKTYDEIINLGILKIGVPVVYALLVFYNTTQEQLVGFNADMVKNLVKKLKVISVFYLMSWPTLPQDLADDKYDVAMGGVQKNFCFLVKLYQMVKLR